MWLLPTFILSDTVRAALRIHFIQISFTGERVVYAWAIKGTFYINAAKPKGQFGFLAIGAINLLYLGTRESIKKKSYSFFLFTHVVGVSVGALAVCNPPHLLTLSPI